MYSPIMEKVLQLRNSGASPIVRFNKNIEQCEGYWEPNMVARIVDIYIERIEESHIARITFDETGFESINDPLASANYYDKNGVACLKGKETQFGPKNGKYSIYIMCNDELFEQIDSSKNALMNKYMESGESKTQTYCEWLENYVIKLEGV